MNNKRIPKKYQSRQDLIRALQFQEREMKKEFAELINSIKQNTEEKEKYYNEQKATKQ
ncbi:MAG: hypothetical protein HOP31_12915 [Ignavibacteria bacterium]|nr:hypothetical protein [Ignavibacteria bacterium]